MISQRRFPWPVSFPRSNATTSSLKDRLELLQSILTICGLLAAAIWFMAQQYDRPSLKLEHAFTQRLSVDLNKTWLIGVEVKATNVGKVPINLQNGVMLMSMVNPAATTGNAVLARDSLRKLYLSPGEVDQAFLKTFEIPDGYKTLLVESRYSVPKTLFGWSIPGATNYEWSQETLIDIGDTKQATPDSGETNRP